MCGIAGIVGLPAAVAEPRVRRALQRLQHRGPDGEGVHVSPEAVIGMRRLAVIDLEGGDQPIYDESRTLAVVCNGEIYDHAAHFARLRARGHVLQSASDVNVVPHGYEEQGAAAVRDWRGMFAAALWDSRRKRLTLWRDRLGKKPLFYAVRGDALAFASELPALLTLLDESLTVDAAAVAEYLTLGFVPHPMAIHRDAWALPPACHLTFQPGAPPRVERYWDRHEVSPFAGTRDDALEMVSGALDEAVRLRLRADVPVGLFLSGGIDSGLVAASAARAGATDLRCFVVEVDDPSLNEAALARETARHLGLPVETIPLRIAPLDAIHRAVEAYGQPFADASAIPSLLVSEAAARQRKVVLNGDGGDEVFAGYRRHQLPGLWSNLPSGGVPGMRVLGELLSAAGSRRGGIGFAARALRGWGLPEPERYLAWTVDLFGARDRARVAPGLTAPPRLPEGGVRPEPRRCGSLREFLWTDTRLLLADGLLTKMDIATMRHSLEARSPFLDVPLMERTWSLPAEWLGARGRTKPLLRDLAARTLPLAVARAPKRGFEVPVARWLAGELRPLFQETVLAPDARIGALLDAPALRAFLADRSAFAGNRAQLEWALLMLELYLRREWRP